MIIEKNYACVNNIYLNAHGLGLKLAEMVWTLLNCKIFLPSQLETLTNTYVFEGGLDGAKISCFGLNNWEFGLI